MTDEEINKYIHVEMMGKCWHAWKDASFLKGDDMIQCIHCSDARSRRATPSNPDYTSDASPRSLLAAAVAKVVEKVGIRVYREVLADIAEDFDGNQWGRSETATAQQITTACVEAHKGATK